MTQATEIVCIVDRSGSMGAIAAEAIGGFNRFLAEQKRLPGAARLSLVLFDHDYRLVVDAVDIRQVPPLDAATYVPRGMTALRDAVGRTIDTVAARLAAAVEEEQPAQVIVAILTDGLENASTDYHPTQIMDMIEERRRDHGWQFVFLAANQEAVATAAAMAIDPDDAYDFVADRAGVAYAFTCLSDEVGRRRGDYARGAEER